MVTASLTIGLTQSCGCLGRERKSETAKKLAKDLRGKTFGRLVVIERDYTSKKNNKGTSAYWLCKCSCGSLKTICASSLVKNKSTLSCGCLSRELASKRGKQLNTLPKGISSFNAVWYYYRYNATKRNLSFKLSKLLFKKLIGLPCFYCGKPPSNLYKNKYGNGDFVYNGIDRKLNNNGYTKENCVPCCYICNKAKMVMSADNFINLAKRISAYHN